MAVLCLLGTAALAVDKSAASKSEKLAAMKAARPLNHHVKVIRTGRALKLDYQLVGADGKTYSLWDIRDHAKPTFAVYKDGVQVGGGSFEFG